MEVLRKVFCFLLVFYGSFCFADELTEKGYSSISDAIKDPKSTNFIALEADSVSLSLFKENIKSFSHLRGLAIQGKIALPSVLWDALSDLDLLEYLFFLDNDLDELSIGGTSSTLKYLWIRNSPYLETESLNSFLNRSNLIVSLRLDQVNFDELPRAIYKMPILKVLQISHSNIVFKDFIRLINKKNKIEKLVISDNNFQFLNRGLKKLKTMKYLDLSGNSLSEEIVHLKHLDELDTLIANRNEFDDLLEITKDIQRVAVELVTLNDQEDKIKGDVEYLLPGKEIVWNSKVFLAPEIVLPTFKAESKTKDEASLDESAKKSTIKAYASVGDVELLSEAYIEYDRLAFPDPLKQFDTLQYIGRYLDSSYVYVERIEIQNHTKEDEKHKLRYSRRYGGVKKKKKTIKINHLDDSHIIFGIYEEKSCDDGLIVTMNFSQIEGKRRNILKPFQQYVWLIRTEGEASFVQHYINQKAWSDVRIEFDEGIFTVALKGRFVDEEFTAELRFKRNPNDMKNLLKNAKRVFGRYQNGLKKEESRFNKSLRKEEKLLLRPYAKDIEKLWTKVEAKMSEQEKAMTRKEWLEYYREVKAAEYSILPNTAFNLAFLSRYMVSQGFREKRTNDFYVGQKWVDATLVYASDTIQIDQLCVIDLDQKMVSKLDVKNNKVLLEPFHNLMIYGMTKEKKYFSLNKEQINQLFNKEKVVVSESDLINSLPSPKNFYQKNIFPKLNY